MISSDNSSKSLNFSKIYAVFCFNSPVLNLQGVILLLQLLQHILLGFPLESDQLNYKKEVEIVLSYLGLVT